MSASELKELRQEVKRYIDHADERVVKMVYALLETDAENELHEDIPSNILEEIKEAIEQANTGQVMTHEDVRKKHAQWFTR